MRELAAEQLERQVIRLARSLLAVWISTSLLLDAFAAPVRYRVEFEAVLGPSGVGYFDWDADSLRMTDFDFSFGETGFSGSIGDTALAEDAGGASKGAFLYFMLTRPFEWRPEFGGTPTLVGWGTEGGTIGDVNFALFTLDGVGACGGWVPADHLGYVVGVYDQVSGFDCSKPTSVGSPNVLVVPIPGTIGLALLALFAMALAGTGQSQSTRRRAPARAPARARWRITSPAVVGAEVRKCGSPTLTTA